jgi:hypothetical protein
LICVIFGNGGRGAGRGAGRGSGRGSSIDTDNSRDTDNNKDMDNNKDSTGPRNKNMCGVAGGIPYSLLYLEKK